MLGSDQGIPVVGPILNRLIGTRNERFVKKYTSRVERINALEAETRRLTDAELFAKAAEFRERHKAGENEDQLMVEAFAVGREAMDRNVGIRNIFNPEHGFDASRLPEGVRGLYEETKARLEGLEARPPADDLLGNTEAVPAWVWADIRSR